MNTTFKVHYFLNFKLITVFISGWTKGSVLSNLFYGWVPPFFTLIRR